ncbi:MAG: CotH kinase family protein [Paludibacteraceae bacterium]|nr:CotH kinase family protein [Paludibacteraceae bacterium]
MKRTLFFSLVVCLCATLRAAVSPSGTLPVLYIQTENNAPITSKEDYINATYYLDNKGLSDYQSIGSKAQPLNMEIRGRGNYTWRDFDKKPYRIKLADKQPLLGMTKSKHFALLAHADDSKGFMRNAIGFQLSKLIGLTWTPTAKPLEVVLNGDYIGLYFLTETIRVDKDRVNIVEQEDEATDPMAITGGWLVEIDNYREDPQIIITEGDYYNTETAFTYKTPEVLSSAQEQFLREEMERINTLVYGDKNSDELWKYLDMEALARFYIVQELTDNYESFHGSCYLYREMGEGEKWYFGPVWDFGSAFNRDKSQYIFEGDVWHNHWIPEICKFPAFNTCLKTLWTDFYKGDFNQIYDYIVQQKDLIASAVQADYQRWPDYGNNDFSNRVTKVTNRLRSYAQWLNENNWAIPEDNSGGDDDEEEDNTNDNPEIEDDDLMLTDMLVWRNGKSVVYSVADVDSITFVQKQGIVVKAKVPDTWKETIYVWIWGDGIEDYEHVAKKQGDWYVFAYEGKELNIIFKNGEGWTGHPNQTEDIYTTRSACYILTQEGEEKAVATQVDCY